MGMHPWWELSESNLSWSLEDPKTNAPWEFSLPADFLDFMDVLCLLEIKILHNDIKFYLTNFILTTQPTIVLVTNIYLALTRLVQGSLKGISHDFYDIHAHDNLMS